MTEDDLQISIVKYLELNEEPKQWTFFHVPMTHKNRQFGSKLKRMGAKAGVSDLVLDVRGRIVYCEVKTETGRQSDSQIRWEGCADLRGSKYYVVRSVDDMQMVLEAEAITIKARL